MALTLAGPDAALLALCVQLDGMRTEWQRLYNATSDATEITTPADHAWQAYNDNVWPGRRRCDDPADLPGRLCDLLATTPEGLRAKAVAILALDDAAAYSDCRDDIYQLHTAMLRDVAGGAYQPLGDEYPAQNTEITEDLPALPQSCSHPRRAVPGTTFPPKMAGAGGTNEGSSLIRA